MRRFGNDGFSMPLVLVLIVAMALLGGTVVTVSNGDARLARLFHSANQADAAAAVGLEHAAYVFQVDGADDRSWPVTGQSLGFDYTVGIVQDQYDHNGDGIAGDVFWDDGVYNEAGNGKPVYLVTAVSRRGNLTARQSLRMTRVDVEIEPKTSLMSNSTVRLVGNVNVSGLDHDIDGNVINASSHEYVGHCHENKPGVVLTDSLETVETQDWSVMGNPRFANNDPPYVVHDDRVVYVHPEDVLGLEPGDLDPMILDEEHYEYADSLAGLVYIDSDWGAGSEGGQALNGTGILIVHNPLYNPREHDPDDEMYDAIKAADSRYQPANLGNINGGTFRGLIIADKVDKIDGNVDILGSVISLTEIDVTIVGAGTAQILYSCDAIQAASANSHVLPHRLSWVAD